MLYLHVSAEHEEADVNIDRVLEAFESILCGDVDRSEFVVKSTSGSGEARTLFIGALYSASEYMNEPAGWLLQWLDRTQHRVYVVPEVLENGRFILSGAPRTIVMGAVLPARLAVDVLSRFCDEPEWPDRDRWVPSSMAILLSSANGNGVGGGE